MGGILDIPGYTLLCGSKNVQTDLPPLKPDIFEVIIHLPIAAKACEETPMRHVLLEKEGRSLAPFSIFSLLS